MPYRRHEAPETIVSGQELTSRLFGIGMRFSVDAPVRHANIEAALISAACAAVYGGKGRLWTVLMDWWAVHHSYINAERLVRALTEIQKPEVTAIFSALAQAYDRKGRCRYLACLYTGERLVLFGEDMRYRLKRDGELALFRDTALAVPQGVYEPKTRDVFSPAQLAAWHRGYHWRVAIGPTYRADLWAACEEKFPQPAYSLAKAAYCSITAARRVLRDFGIATELRTVA